MSAPAIARPASFWSAMPSRPPAPSPGPAPTRCSRTSSGSATSIFRRGSRPTACTRTRSRPSTTIRSSRPATMGDPPRPTAFARCRSTTASAGGRSAGHVSWSGSVRRTRAACLRRCPAESLRVTPLRRHILVIVVAVVVSLIDRLMRLMALVIPELAIDAVGGEQLGVRCRARSPCRLRLR